MGQEYSESYKESLFKLSSWEGRVSGEGGESARLVGDDGLGSILSLEPGSSSLVLYPREVGSGRGGG